MLPYSQRIPPLRERESTVENGEISADIMDEIVLLGTESAEVLGNAHSFRV